ncbi:hypothetical protein RQP46_001953 [Phenoliferia psychrophenolica]
MHDPDPFLAIPTHSDLLLLDDDDETEWQRWDSTDTHAVLFTFLLLPTFPNLKRLSMSSIAVGLLFGLEGAAVSEALEWKTLPEGKEDQEQRRKAIGRLAPRIKWLNLTHYDTEFPDGVAPKPALAALIIPLFTNLTYLWIYFNSSPLTPQHITSISLLPHLSSLFLELVGPSSPSTPLSYTSWSLPPSPSLSQLRINGPGPLWDLIIPWFETLQCLTVSSRTSIDDDLLDPSTFPPFPFLHTLEITQTPAETIDLLALFASSPIEILQLNFSSANLPDDTTSSTFSPTSPLFSLIRTTFPDVEVTISDDLPTSSSSSLGATLNQTWI